MRNIILIFVLILLPLSLLAQTTQVELKWGDVLTEVLGDDTLHVLQFDGAVLAEDEGMLPRYHAVFPLTGPADEASFTVEISDKVWQQNKVVSFSGKELLTTSEGLEYHVVSSRKKYALEVWVTPIRKNGNAIETLSSFAISVTRKAAIRSKSASLATDFAEQSLLSTGTWKKISIARTGIYKLTYSDLKGMGLDPDNIRLFGYGGPMLDIKFIDRKYDDLQENALYYNDGGDGKMNEGDFVLFYGLGPVGWSYSSAKNEFIHVTHKYADKAIYFLSSDHGKGKRIENAPETVGDAVMEVRNFTDYDVWEPEVNNLLSSGMEWFGVDIKGNESVSRSFSFDDVVTDEDAQLSFSVVSRTENSSANLSFYMNDNLLGSTSVSISSKGNTGDYAKKANVTYFAKPSSGNLNLKWNYLSTDETATGNVNYFRVNVRRQLKFKSAFLAFRDEKSLGNGIANFVIQSTSSDVLVLDVTEPTAAALMPASFSNNQTTFKTDVNVLKEFVAFNPKGSFEKPSIVGDVKNQNLHGLPQVDMVIIAHPDFLESAEDLSELHAAEGIRSHIVTPEQIYNEFSSGQADITAFRWFLKMFYDRAVGEDDMIRYLLLFGDGTFDNMGRNEKSKSFNFIPTYQSVESLNMSTTYVSDDYYGMLDATEGEMGNYDRVDIGVGRLPVSSVKQAKDLVSKIKYYTENRKRNSWKNTVCFVGDDEDNNIHMRDANRMADKVMNEHPEMVVNKILLDAFQQTAEASGQRYPEAEAQVEQSMQQGVLLWNYSGHGGETGLTEEQIMTKKKVKDYENLSNLPVWVTATCEFSRFDLYTETTAGEHVLLSPIGGGVGLFTTTRIVYSSSNFTINNNFFDYVFETDEKGRQNRLGDVCRLTKAATGTGVNKRKFLLLGDPALKMHYPTLDVQTSAINGIEVGEGISDTISALETLSIKGFIQTESGDTAHDFNGFVYSQVFDKMKSISTINNDNASEDTWSPLTFNLWQDLVFTGKSEVVNGKFEFSFKLPKEINYEFGKGRIVYYASSDQAEANGYYENVVIGGFSDNAVADESGPSLTMYMNQPDFVDGGVVNPDPLLVVEIMDENGISTAGSGIGHDIVVMLDEDPGTLTVLNTYYEAINGNTEGNVKYKFSDLSEGEHTLFFRVWDIYNNSTVKEISFVVEANEIPDVTSLTCYPNPARDVVEFVFEHDRPESVLEITVEIFSVNGQKMAVLDAYSYSSSNKIDPIEWDLTGGNGLKVNPGIYLYRTVIKVNDKQSVGATKKLIVL